MNKVVYYLVYGIWYLLSLLPFCVHYLFSDFVYLILYRLIGYRVKVVRNNLTTSFPEKSEAEIREIERKFYHRLCDYFVEAVKMMTMSERQIRRRMVFKNTEALNKCFDENQSIALYLGHTFNWEWITSLPLWITKKVHCGELYHALENEAFDKLFLHLRERWGSECIPLVDILRKTIEYKHKQQTTIIGYLGDQVPHWNNIHHWCWFLNHDTPVMTGTERIAIKNRQAIFFLEMTQKKRGYYEAEFKLISRTPEQFKEFEITDIYHQMLEANIRHQPELWLWSHKRWKRTREEFEERFMVVNGKVVPKEEDK
jgi:KDO2-lipid IV(A) lauroyltransferase